MTGLPHLLFDPDLAAHVAAALSGYRRALLSVGRPVPDSVEELLAQANRVARSGQKRDIVPAPREHRSMPRYLLGTSDAASVVGVSPRTLRRRIAAGTLPVVRDGRRVLVHPDDLLGYIEGRRSE